MTSSLTAGVHNISATYSGDEGYGSSTQTITETINPVPTPPPPAPVPNNNFALFSTAVARDGTITFAESAPDPGTFTATAVAVSQSGHLASVRGAAAKCKPTRKHRCMAKARTPALYGTGSTTTAAAGVIQLVIKPNRKARTALAQGKTLHLSVSVTFQSARGGAPKTTIASVTAKGAKRKNRRHK